ncbi:UPF0149 family protein [Arenimonas oryziterrae]|uniref:YecA family protein n=1 Tax=Arenimonas oryziterrae DSM 21050 = YC6267 TaxID=1121015 RepID=A0A091AUH8_9GAMM|nr:UPF0149 family protein [Arenimonas oryziterrae]KFN43898.1 hypothetical protein N789_08090 [Arenimonas oryziterrae DSM 21050 = YC6267]
MTAPAYLSDAQIDRLGDLLDQRAVPFQGFNLEALDGYLSALAVSPGQDIPASEWQPAVWGPKPPRWESPAEATEIETLLLGHWNACVARARQGEDLPEHLSPLLWLPEDPEGDQPDDLDIGRDWAFGFFRGVELRGDAWDAWLDKADWIDEIFALLEQLATGEVVPENAADPVGKVSYRERLEIVASLPGMLADLHEFRIAELTPREPVRKSDTPDRNALCPCGSGKKYKKCHGQN